MSGRVLILVSHPKLSESTVNRAMLDAIRALEDVSIRHLDALYPDFQIDVEAEQEALGEHDTLVAQHPLYWYSSPPHLKQWIDKVLLHGFAFGPGAKAIRAKRWFSAVSAGGPESSYGEGGFNAYEIADFLKVFERTAAFCKMAYQPPLILHDAYRLTPEQIKVHAGEYRQRIEALISGASDRGGA